MSGSGDRSEPPAAMEPSSVPTADQPGRLLRHRDFRLFWIGESTSSFGTAISKLALPLVAVSTLHGGAFALGVLYASAWVPWLVIGLPAGAWVDRLSRRPLMIACDVAAALSLVSVPVASWVGVLTVAQLIVVAVLSGSAAVLFTTAYAAYLPTLLSAEHLMKANGALQAAGPWPRWPARAWPACSLNCSVRSPGYWQTPSPFWSRQPA